MLRYTGHPSKISKAENDAYRTTFFYGFRVQHELEREAGRP